MVVVRVDKALITGAEAVLVVGSAMGIANAAQTLVAVFVAELVLGV
jgi:hypothetical protein